MADPPRSCVCLKSQHAATAEPWKPLDAIRKEEHIVPCNTRFRGNRSGRSEEQNRAFIEPRRFIIFHQYRTHLSQDPSMKVSSFTEKHWPLPSLCGRDESGFRSWINFVNSPPRTCQNKMFLHRRNQ